jgi:spermidine synthase
MNENSLNNKKVSLVYNDAFQFLENNNLLFDVIIIELPDPNNVDLNKLYTKEFYFLCNKRLAKNGALITQAGSPYYASKAYYCIDKSMQAGGFNTLQLHNQILTMGEWGWIIGSKNLTTNQIKTKVTTTNYNQLNLKWLNNEASEGITLFGKPLVDTTNTSINTLFNPVLYTYYKAGNWKIY